MNKKPHQTILYDRHVGLGARITPFSGWEMPLHYGSQIQEHHAVRRSCGVFDVSHMGIVDLTGGDPLGFLQLMLACDPERLHDGGGQYGLLLNDHGGVTDDLIAYRLAGDRFCLVINAGNREKDLAWLRIHAPAFKVTVSERTDLAMLAVQGPLSTRRMTETLPEELAEAVSALPGFHILERRGWRVARTGYTGEEGYEVMLPLREAVTFWDRLLHAGVAAAGLGARDTLRLEAGLSLYGRDLHDKGNPLECGLGWTIAWDPPQRKFIGRPALEPLRHDPAVKKRIGLILEEKGVLRDQQTVLLDATPVGVITSGGYSPTLERGIALAIVERHLQPGSACQVDVRGRLLNARAVRPPFVRFGKSALRD
ncbi:MAG: glycine cleavage system aminomethyltransferase GcvT [Magnetococcales bacterium]|nr:glycine cleavage system aminomethyltransferase GcvT [Magnetococcales bacterium]